jgi:hypothetical protein
MLNQEQVSVTAHARKLFKGSQMLNAHPSLRAPGSAAKAR